MDRLDRVRRHRFRPIEVEIVRQTVIGLYIGMGGIAVVLCGLVYAAGMNDETEPGRVLYERHCAACHGAEGQGRVQGNATSLNNPDFLALASDAFLHTTIARGRRGTAMRGWSQAASGPLSDAEIRALIAFLRDWRQEVSAPHVPPGERGDPGRGRQLYETACANCHGWEGRGDLGMGPAVTNPDFLAAADDAFLWATIAYGRRGTPMFPSLRGLDGVRQLHAQEIYDLVAYLRSPHSRP